MSDYILYTTILPLEVAMPKERADWLDEKTIYTALEQDTPIDATKVKDILNKSKELQGLNFEEVAILCRLNDQHMLNGLFEAAKQVKEEIYGKRIVLFAPLYISNLCYNECSYCAFRVSNTLLERKALGEQDIQEETLAILEQGHKRILMVAGESYAEQGGFSYVLNAIETIYKTKGTKGESIRRVNANVAPLDEHEFAELKSTGIGTYQLFQETYHRETYKNVHTRGKKADYDWRLTGIDRAMRVGIDDVGLGALLGLTDWRFELLAMIMHIKHLEDVFGVGCHTISVPRIEPAVGSDLASAPPHPVSDEDFKKIVAILRLAVPYTGIIMSTRETALMRKATLELGVSQMSAGSHTDPGGNRKKRDEQAAQFQLGDHRSLAEVIEDLSTHGFIPSFCTACYRTGRTGHDFMELAKPGNIKTKCGPNALSTYLEYLLDYTPDGLENIGRQAIERELSTMDEKARKRAEKMLDSVEKGQRDVYL